MPKEKNNAPAPPPSPEEIARLAAADLPSAPVAEAGLIAALIVSPPLLSDVAPLCGAADFFALPHQVIVEALVKLHDAGTQASFAALIEHLAEIGQLEVVGGIEGLVQRTDAAVDVTPAAALDLARVVGRKAAQRRLIEATERSVRTARQGDLDPEAILDACAGHLEDAAGAGTTRREAQAASEIVAAVSETFGREEAATAIPSGFADYDALMVGHVPGEMTVLGARPSMGKTAIALNWAHYAAVMAGTPTAVFSMEMTRAQLGARLIASAAGVSSRRLAGTEATAYERDEAARAVEQLDGAPLWIDDSGGLTMASLRAKVMRLRQRHAVELVVVDYLQLMSGGSNGRRSDNRESEIASISRGLKALTLELDLAMIVLSQLNRGVENRDNKRPRGSDLRESGAIEQDADNIVLVHREDYYHRGDIDYAPTNMVELIIDKHRNGDTGIVKLRWDGATATARDLATPEQIQQSEMYA